MRPSGVVLFKPPTHHRFPRMMAMCFRLPEDDGALVRRPGGDHRVSGDHSPNALRVDTQTLTHLLQHVATFPFRDFHQTVLQRRPRWDVFESRFLAVSRGQNDNSLLGHNQPQQLPPPRRAGPKHDFRNRFGHGSMFLFLTHFHGPYG